MGRGGEGEWGPARYRRKHSSRVVKIGAPRVDSTFGILDVIAFLVFAILIAVAVVMIVFLGQLPGRLARQRGHPQASAKTPTRARYSEETSIPSYLRPEAVS